MIEDDPIIYAVGELIAEERATELQLEALRGASQITWRLGEDELGRATDRLIAALVDYDRIRTATVMRRLRDLAG